MPGRRSKRARGAIAAVGQAEAYMAGTGAQQAPGRSKAGRVAFDRTAERTALLGPPDKGMGRPMLRVGAVHAWAGYQTGWLVAAGTVGIATGSHCAAGCAHGFRQSGEGLARPQ